VVLDKETADGAETGAVQAGLEVGLQVGLQSGAAGTHAEVAVGMCAQVAAGTHVQVAAEMCVQVAAGAHEELAAVLEWSENQPGAAYGHVAPVEQAVAGEMVVVRVVAEVVAELERSDEPEVAGEQAAAYAVRLAGERNETSVAPEVAFGAAEDRVDAVIETHCAEMPAVADVAEYELEAQFSSIWQARWYGPSPAHTPTVVQSLSQDCQGPCHPAQ
jgi:hypothetical protein